MVGTFNSLESTFVRDVTGDGIADWVHLDDGGVNAIRVWPGRDDGTFLRSTIITTTPAKPTGDSVPGDSVPGNIGDDTNFERTFLLDLTQDGIPDLVTSNNTANGGSIDVYPGQGDGTWYLTGPKVKSTTGLVAAAGGGVTLGGTGDVYLATFLRDVTGDGIPAWVNADDGGVNAIVMWPGKGDGTFETNPTNVPRGRNARIVPRRFSQG